MLQKQVDNIEKQRNYLMRKLQQTKNNMETDKFRIMKDFEVEKLDLLKKIEELLMLNDILAGQRVIYDTKGHKIDTKEILDMLNPFQLLQQVHGSKRTQKPNNRLQKRSNSRRQHQRHRQQPFTKIHRNERRRINHPGGPAQSDHSRTTRTANERR